MELTKKLIKSLPKNSLEILLAVLLVIAGIGLIACPPDYYEITISTSLFTKVMGSCIAFSGIALGIVMS